MKEDDEMTHQKGSLVASNQFRTFYGNFSNSFIAFIFHKYSFIYIYELPCNVFNIFMIGNVET